MTQKIDFSEIKKMVDELNKMTEIVNNLKEQYKETKNNLERTYNFLKSLLMMNKTLDKLPDVFSEENIEKVKVKSHELENYYLDLAEYYKQMHNITDIVKSQGYTLKINIDYKQKYEKSLNKAIECWKNVNSIMVCN